MDLARGVALERDEALADGVNPFHLLVDVVNGYGLMDGNKPNQRSGASGVLLDQVQVVHCPAISRLSPCGEGVSATHPEREGEPGGE
jgi:hypothetical protein